MPATNTIKTVSEICTERYGVNALQTEPLTIEWAADHALDQGADLATVRRELRGINRKRESMGRIPFSPRFGSRLF